MPGFAPACPKCHSTDVAFLGMHDHYPEGSSRQRDSRPDLTVFTYRCECGLTFSFDIIHGQNPVSKATGLREP